MTAILDKNVYAHLLSVVHFFMFLLRSFLTLDRLKLISGRDRRSKFKC
jgi:hypothetical protein